MGNNWQPSLIPGAWRDPKIASASGCWEADSGFPVEDTECPAARPPPPPTTPPSTPGLDKCDNEVQLLTFACMGKIMLVVNSWNYYAKLPLPHVIFNGPNCKYESWNTVLSSLWILLFRTVAWCTASTVTVTWCKLQAAVSGRDRRAREEEESCWGY